MTVDGGRWIELSKYSVTHKSELRNVAKGIDYQPGDPPNLCVHLSPLVKGQVTHPADGAGAKKKSLPPQQGCQHSCLSCDRDALMEGRRQAPRWRHMNINPCFTAEESQLHGGAPPPSRRLVLSHWKKLRCLLSADQVPEHTRTHTHIRSHTGKAVS